MEIIPAILPKDFSNLEESVESVKGLVPMVQVDICDGKYVSNFTWPYRRHDNNFEAILREERGLPNWDEVNYEIDLMVKDPEEDVMRWLTAGASRIVIHLESTQHLDAVLKHTGELVDIGLGVKIDTPMEKIDAAFAEHGEQIKFIQCMGIRRIGYQGQDFDDRVYQKIRDLKAKYPNLPISVDGGVSLENAHLLKEAGADRLVVGSAIFGTDNIPEALHEFEQI
jgi:ribulose-phosphate 3-epimerase